MTETRGGSAILDAATRLGAKLKKVGACEFAGPCPLCGGRDRFSVNTKKDVFSCRGCGVGDDAIALVRHVNRSSYGEALAFLGRDDGGPRPRSLGAAAAAHDNGNGPAALKLWRESGDPCLLVERYLASRELELEDDVAGRVPRWNDDIDALAKLFGPIARGPSIGAMVVLFRSIEDDEPRAIQCTYFDREGRRRVVVGKDGREIKRMSLGPVKGAAIKLDADEDVLAGLFIGEGLETCLTARQHYGLRPCWALGSKGAIGAFPVLDGTECLTILAERDAEREVETCAARWHAAGRKIYVDRSLGGKDLNDVLMARRAQP
jgi:hypothetical protein